MNTLAALIHSMDPYHPVGTATPDITAATLYQLNTLAPNIDVVRARAAHAAPLAPPARPRCARGAACAAGAPVLRTRRRLR